MKKFLPILILLGLFLPTVIVATIVAPLPKLELLPTLERITNALFTVLLAISLIFLAYAGFLFVTAAGDATKVEKARDTILYAIIGLIVAALAWGIREFLRRQLGF